MQHNPDWCATSSHISKLFNSQLCNQKYFKQKFEKYFYCLEERLRDSRSHSPALMTMGHVGDIVTRPSSVQHVSYDTRPASQLSAHTLHAYSSSRSSRSSKHGPRPVPVLYSGGPQDRSKYCVIPPSCRQKQDQVNFRCP